MRSSTVLRHDHLAEEEERLLGILAVEHVLGAEEADAFGAESSALCGVFGRVGVGADAELADGVADLEEAAQQVVLFGGVHHGQLAVIDGAFGAVEGDPVAFLEVCAADRHGLSSQFDLECAAADDAALAPAAGDERRVGCHAAAGGEDGLGGAHAFDVFGVGFFADEDDLFALLCPFDGFVGGEYDLAGRAAGTCGKAFGDGVVILFRPSDR